ncbi:MAG: signal recognition particle receptor subunit alpha [Dehalococcoidia bacterium]|nr:signal recognition particle receptor subunit alpha [Dehalococcoidia bacterium]
MLDSLSEKLQHSLGKLRGTGRIRDEDLDLTLRDIRVAMLEADVHFKVVREFLDALRKRIQGAELINSIAPGQQIAAAVHEALIDSLGKDTHTIKQESDGPTRILIIGPKGSGKTTLCGRIALHFKEKGLKAHLIATDFERVAASEQLQVIANTLDVACYVESVEAKSSDVAKRGLLAARQNNADVIIVDSSGIVDFTDEQADSLAELADAVDPTELLLVVDAMMGQEAVNLASAVDEALEGTGIVVTKLDSDAKGGSLLSVKSVTGLPIKFITTGEELAALEEFHPERFASRLLGMGDVASLVEKAKKSAPEIDSKKLQKKCAMERSI